MNKWVLDVGCLLTVVVFYTLQRSRGPLLVPLHDRDDGGGWLHNGSVTGWFVICGASLLLGSCLFPCLLWSFAGTDRGDSGKDCRPDQPLEGRATAAITSLHVYPVKACAGHKLEKATLGARGLEMDRLWMIVDGNGRFMSQRRCPKMALIKPSLPKTMDEPLLLSAPDMPDIEVPVMTRVGLGGSGEGGELVEVEVWQDTCRARDQGNTVASWIRAFLDTDHLRLVRMEDNFVRSTDPNFGTGFRTGFADGFPMLLTAEESLGDLNARMPLGECIGMDRFRPNIVVQGWGAWAEDEWTKIRVAGINMRTPKPCGRCSVPTINQRTLERRREPRATMEKFRTGEKLGFWKKSWAKNYFFGMNVLHERRGVLRVGDEVEVLRMASNTTVDGRGKEGSTSVLKAD